MSRYLTLLAGLGLASPLAAAGQDLPRYYVGLAAYSSIYQPLGGNARGTTVPVQLALGYQYSPRLAVQLGLIYVGFSDRYVQTGTRYNSGLPDGTNYSYTGRYAEHKEGVTLLARYRVRRRLDSRFQVELLGGTTVQVAHSRDTGIYEENLPGVTYTASYEFLDAYQALLLTAGAGVGYRVGRHLEAQLDMTLNQKVIGSGFEQRSGVYKGITTATALGVRYRFGQAR